MTRDRPSRILRLFSRLVPKDSRDEWVREWDAEWRAVDSSGVSPRRVARLAGAFEDGLRMRLRSLARSGAFTGDLRFAARSLVRSPKFSVATVLTLGLGIGMAATVFGVVDGTLLSPLPYTDADRIVRIDNLTDEGPYWGSSVQNYEDYRARTRSFETMGYRLPWTDILQGEVTRRVVGAGVSASFMTIFAPPPALGTYFREEDDFDGHAPMMILSHGFWSNELAADSAVVGRSFTFVNGTYQVVGVAPPNFRDPSGEAEVWVLRPGYLSEGDRSSGWLELFARLAPEATLDLATEELAVVSTELEREYPEANDGRLVIARDLHTSLFGPVRPILLLVGSAVGILLLIACANVTTLLLGRLSMRAGDLSLRTALGASRGRIFSHLLAEAVLLASLGALVGYGFSAITIDLLAGNEVPGLPAMADLEMSRTVLLFLGLCAAGSVVVVGLPPFVSVGSRRGRARMERGSWSTHAAGSVRIRTFLVGGQIALSTALLVVAGLLGRGYLALHSTDLGFDPDGAIVAAIGAGPGIPNVVGFWNQVEEELTARPEIDEVGRIDGLPVAGGAGSYYAQRADQPTLPLNEQLLVASRTVTPGYFEAIGMRLLQGRWLEAADNRSDASPVAVVNETLARTLFPEGDVLGRSVFTHGAPHEIVGISVDVRTTGAASPSQPSIYIATGGGATPYWTRWNGRIVVRTQADLGAVAPLIRSAVQRVNPIVPVESVRPMDRIIADNLRVDRFNALVLVLFATFATLLAAVGIAGVMMFMVASRTREIGIRRALGAGVSQITGLITRHTGVIVGVGLMLGLIVAVAGVRLASSIVAGVAPWDPVAFLTGPLVIGSVAFLAALLPARMASRVEAISVLRQD